MTIQDSDVQAMNVYRDALKVSLRQEREMRETLSDAQRRVTAYESAFRETLRVVRARVEVLNANPDTVRRTSARAELNAVLDQLTRAYDATIGL